MLLFPCPTQEWAANVCYQEYDVPDEFPLELRQYLPNVNYTHDAQRQDLRNYFQNLSVDLTTVQCIHWGTNVHILLLREEIGKFINQSGI